MKSFCINRSSEQREKDMKHGEEERSGCRRDKMQFKYFNKKICSLNCEHITERGMIMGEKLGM